jgi:hypothetical protein
MLSARTVFLFAAGAAFSAAAADVEEGARRNAAVIAREADVDVRLPPEETVVFRGMASFDAVGGQKPSMLYVGGVAGLVVGVLTHGAIESGVQKRARDKAQETADQILAPYSETLRAYRHRELVERAIRSVTAGGRKNLLDAGARAESAPVVAIQPVFSMTQDQTAIVLDNDIAVFRAGQAGEPGYRNAIRIVSSPRETETFPDFWLAEGGAKLKEESAALLAESLRIALAEASGNLAPSGGQFRTVRYPEGKAEKIERAQIVSTGCDRLLIRTLREWLISVPLRTDAAAQPCAPEAKAR